MFRSKCLLLGALLLCAVNTFVLLRFVRTSSYSRVERPSTMNVTNRMVCGEPEAPPFLPVHVHASYGSASPGARMRCTSPSCSESCKEATTYRCLHNHASERGATCRFSNLYRLDGQYQALVLAECEAPSLDTLSAFSMHREESVIVHTLPFDSCDMLRAYVDEQVSGTELTIVADLAVVSTGLWLHNIAHALFDGIYPPFTSLIEWKETDSDFYLILHEAIECPDVDLKRCLSTYDVFERFAGAGLTRIVGLRPPKEPYLRFDDVVVGSQFRGGRTVTHDVTLPYAVSLDAMRLFRARVYRTHGVKFDPRHACLGGNTRRRLTGIVYDNRRFNDTERAMFRRVAAQVSDSMNVDVSFRTHQETGLTLTQQLRTLRNLCVYVSGPGTGLLSHPFLPDGSVVVNVGAFEMWERSQSALPVYMETNILSGTSAYQRALYYPSSQRHLGLNEATVADLLSNAVLLVRERFRLPVNTYDNLSAESKIFVDLCDSEREWCARYLDSVNLYGLFNEVDYQCHVHNFAEFLVYAQGPWCQKCDWPVEKRCSMPNSAMTRLRALVDKRHSELSSAVDGNRLDILSK